MTRTAIAAAAAVALAGAAATAAAKDVTVPKGTYLELKSESPFDSDSASRGDTFTATVTRGLWVDGRLVIPAGSAVTGTIKAVRSPKDGSKSAALGVKFESMAAGGRSFPIEGVLVSLMADNRKKILEQEGKVTTGRKVDVIFIGHGTEADMKADTLVGISGADRDDLADEWAKSGLGPAVVRVTPGTSLTMEFKKDVSLPALTATRAAGDRSILTAPDTIKGVQQALKSRNYYTGEATGTLDQPTRDALARFQLDQKQLATGDADDTTITALGVNTASTNNK
jgi:putative peptidoglycan binding protein